MNSLQGSNLLQDLYSYQNGPAASPQGFQSPTMSGDGFNWYGGSPLIPEGGPYNQMAQDMAGPSYAPAGSNYYSMPAQQFAPAVGGAGKGAIGSPIAQQPVQSAPSVGGKGGTAKGALGFALMQPAAQSVAQGAPAASAATVQPAGPAPMMQGPTPYVAPSAAPAMSPASAALPFLRGGAMGLRSMRY